MPANESQSGPTRRRLLVAVLLLGIGIRFLGVDRPFDFRSLTSWREADYLQIARAFDSEGMNAFHPRVDWRGDTPGYTEMEFPALPWVGALLYRVFGPREQILRALSALASTLGLLAFARLAWRALPPRGAILATAAFATNPLLAYLSAAIQPESLMILFTILAMGAVWRWVENDAQCTLLAACVLAAAAILVKAFAVYLGLVLAYFVLRKQGLRSPADRRTWIAAAIALLPPLAWYGWAHHLYLETGLSLGVTNETHWLSWAVLRQPLGPALGNIKAESRSVFVLAGLPLATCALLLPWAKIERGAVWYLAVVACYVLAADTSGDRWSFYYHSTSVPAACLLMGYGLVGLTSRSRLAGLLPNGEALLRVAGYALAALVIAASCYKTVGILRWRDHQPQQELFYRCARQFAPNVPEDARIVVGGGTKFDPHGHPVAYNESMAFAWMDRRGFNYAKEDYSVETLAEMARRGGRYWVSKPGELRDEAIRREVERRFQPIDRCHGYALYDLGPG